MLSQISFSSSIIKIELISEILKIIVNELSLLVKEEYSCPFLTFPRTSFLKYSSANPFGLLRSELQNFPQKPPQNNQLDRLNQRSFERKKYMRCRKSAQVYLCHRNYPLVYQEKTPWEVIIFTSYMLSGAQGNRYTTIRLIRGILT